MASANRHRRKPLQNLVVSPLKFVESAFPWGQGLLDGESGPDTWQRDVLLRLETQLSTSEQPLHLAVASGHGVGKSALVAWIVLWFLSTRPHAQVVVSSNTKVQLDTKTWRELAKWHKLGKIADWFRWTSTRFYHAEHPETWFAAAIPWSKDRPEAFAGTHEQHVLMIFDEASAIDDVIWETASGAMTTPRAMWLAFGNPTRNTGRFKQCFPGGRFAHRWQTLQVDSRTAKKANQAQIQQWIEDYGEDSDFSRVRIKGTFPRTSSLQFIGEDLIQLAQSRFADAIAYDWAPRIIGCDIARFGDDATVILVRQGNRLLETAVYRQKSTTEVAGLVAHAITSYEPSAVFVDQVGIGSGVVDQLQALGHRVIGVNAGESASEPTRFRNLRAEMWSKLRDWLRESGCLDPQDIELAAQLMGLEYGYDISERLQLEKKEDLKSRGLASPDIADALALTFARPVTMQARSQPRVPQIAHGVDWSPLSDPPGRRRGSQFGHGVNWNPLEL
jgi:hypothetical protein